MVNENEIFEGEFIDERVILLERVRRLAEEARNKDEELLSSILYGVWASALAHYEPELNDVVLDFMNSVSNESDPPEETEHNCNCTHDRFANRENLIMEMENLADYAEHLGDVGVTAWLLLPKIASELGLLERLVQAASNFITVVSTDVMLSYRPEDIN